MAESPGPGPHEDIEASRKNKSAQDKSEGKWRSRLNPLRWGSVPPVPDARASSREHEANFFAKLTFEWISPLITVAYKRPLEQGDIWTVNPDRSVEALTSKVKDAFWKHAHNGQKNPLFWALYEAFRFEFWLGGIGSLLGTIFRVLSPFTLRFLIQFATDTYQASATGTTVPPLGVGFGLTVLITMMLALQSLFLCHFIYCGLMIGGQAKGVLIGMIYEKAMLISNKAKFNSVRMKLALEEGHLSKESLSLKTENFQDESSTKPTVGWPDGRISNLMSIHTHRIELASALFHTVWTSPIACVLSLALLCVNLTYSALPGCGLLIFGVPLLTKALRHVFKGRTTMNMTTDKRVSLLGEILQGIRFIKLFGWEQPYMARLNEIRAKETNSLRLFLISRDVINSLSLSLPNFAAMLSFTTFSLANNELTPAKVFSALALFTTLKIPLSQFPIALSRLINASVSMSEIEDFLLQEEFRDDFEYQDTGMSAVAVSAAAFTWESSATQQANDPKMTNRNTEKTSINNTRGPFELRNVNLSVGKGELVAIIGAVGSGKSSLLAGLAGEMRKISGEVVVSGSRALCSQVPWIQNTTFEKNITFGKPMDTERYQRIIQACALQPDLDSLPQGDQTEIGERGITISGGQKQRLNIARAIYTDADIVFMDDPLSAVDAHVGRHIFDHAILALLQEKACVLVTHQLWVLSRCDRVVWMKDGKIEAIDTYDNLIRDHQSFHELVQPSVVTEETQDSTAPKELVPKEGQDLPNKKATQPPTKITPAATSWNVYVAYFRASGTIFNAAAIFLMLALFQVANVMVRLWLSYWTSHRYSLSKGQYIAIYAGIDIFHAMIHCALCIMISVVGLRASKSLVSEATSRVLRAPMSFFDTTPQGHITSRFSRDTELVDNNLSLSWRIYMTTISTVVCAMAVVVAFFHYFAVALGPLYLLFVGAAMCYHKSAGQIKGFESAWRASVHAKFAEGLTGVSCIRTYGLRQRFIRDICTSIDNMNSACFLVFSNQQWLSIRLDMIGNTLVFTVCVLVVTSRFNIDPSISGLVLSYIVVIVQMLQFSTRQFAEVQNAMRAAGRLHQYGTELEEEAPLHTIEVPKSWPDKGEIIFEDVHMQYRADLPPVLRNISLHIRGGERLGIIGRTGAGKSSIVNTIFRLVEISSGSISIDGLNVSTLGLHDLRSRLAIIPQDPTLFHGTIRSNLDPFGEKSDLELWSALKQAHLVPENGSIVEGCEPEKSGGVHLDTAVEDGGLNFSLGQRQLMALARALARDSRIIICDEATSSVDIDTDNRIQETMATRFQGKTLICIAHRLRTILSYDRICVMDEGRVAELDTPLALWEHGGIFRSMCDRSGIRVEDIENAAT